MPVNNFNPNFWGPKFWSVLHTVSFAYPDNPSQEEKKHHIDFILNLQYVLPCEACRQHVMQNLRKMKFGIHHMKNKDTFSKFVYDLHNEVNKMLGKPKYKTYAEVRKDYT